MEQEKLFTAGHKCIYVRTTHIYSLIWVNFGVRDSNTVVLSMCELRGNRRCLDRTSLMGVIEGTLSRAS